MLAMIFWVVMPCNLQVDASFPRKELRRYNPQKISNISWVVFVGCWVSLYSKIIILIGSKPRSLEVKAVR
jgi:uncharacterized membrane protein YccF (DUF307 family)